MLKIKGMGSRKYTESLFIDAVSLSYSYSDVCRKLGISPKGGNLKTVREKIEKLGLDKSHFTGSRWNKGKTAEDHPSIRKTDISKILVENSGWTSSAVRNRLIKEGLKEHRCECCGRTEWMGVPIPLELHHINEIHTDNRLENLLVLCPNCHALTDSHTSVEKLSALIEKLEVEGRKIREALVERFNKILSNGNPEPSIVNDNNEGAETLHDRPKSRKNLQPKICPICGNEFLPKHNELKYCSQECSHKGNGSKRPPIFELLEKFEELKSFVLVGKFYGVSDNAVRKWCKLYGILDMVKRKSRPQTE